MGGEGARVGGRSGPSLPGTTISQGGGEGGEGKGCVDISKAISRYGNGSRNGRGKRP